MKKTSFFAVTLLVAAFAMLTPDTAKAQKFQGQMVATGGAGYSIAGLIFEIAKDGLNTVGDVKSTKTPVIFGGFDYGITDRFSVGAAYTYQGLTAKYSAYETVDTAGNIVTTIGDFTDRLTRQSIGIRPLFHLGDNDDLDTYIGARFSYVFWTYSGRTDVDVQDFFGLFGSPIKPQAILGMRYFFTPNIGFNAEFAVGPTYFMMFGLNARFGGGA